MMKSRVLAYISPGVESLEIPLECFSYEKMGFNGESVWRKQPCYNKQTRRTSDPKVYSSLLYSYC